jgi:hypothetical protein
MRWCSLVLMMGCADKVRDIGTSAVDVLDPMCRAPGTICTLMGTGVAGRGAEGAASDESALYMPADMVLGLDGRLVVADAHNHRIRRMARDGTVTTVAGRGGSGDGPEGTATDAGLSIPTSLTVDDAGALWVAAWQNSRLARVDMDSGTLTFECGTGERGYSGSDVAASAGILDLPVSVSAAPGGPLYLFDQANQLLRVVADDRLRDVAGSQRDQGYSGDGGEALSAQFHATVGQTAGPANKIDVSLSAVFVADTQNHVVRRVDLDAGTIHTVAGRRSCDVEGQCTGEPVRGGGPGPAEEVGLRYPVDVAIGPDGALYVADTMNHCVRVIRDGWTSTFAGSCGIEGYDGDLGPSDGALLSRPEGVMVDGEGHVYIADTYNHVIRVVHP